MKKKTPTKKVATVKTVGAADAYSASIKILGKIYTATGATKREALENLKPELGRGVSIITVSTGDKRKEKVLAPMQTMRLFSPSKLMREIALKNTALLFDL